MKIDYYINELNKKPEKKPVLHSCRDIDSYDINEDKIELIKSVKDHIDEETYINGFDIYNDYKQPAYEFSRFQVMDSDGVRALAPILITWEGGMSFAGEIVDKEKFMREYNSLNLIGSQDYTSLIISQGFYDYQEDHPIYYTSDGNVFISSNTAFFIRSTKIDDLGKKLAISLKYHNEYEADLARRRKDVLVKNYRRLR